MCEKVLHAPQQEMDVYLRGFRNLYPSVELLRSKEARETYKTDMKKHWMSTDVIERKNSTILRSHPHSAPAHIFIYAARESVIDQTNALHKAREGAGPLHQKLNIAPGQTDRVTVNPLLIEPQILEPGDARDGVGAVLEDDLIPPSAS